jgi:hypothetical protein
MYDNSFTGTNREEKMAKGMYVRHEGKMFVLRQTRFAEKFANGVAHPHDICVLAHTVEEMHRMADPLFPDDIDYSQVESPQG